MYFQPILEREQLIHPVTFKKTDQHGNQVQEFGTMTHPINIGEFGMLSAVNRMIGEPITDDEWEAINLSAASIFHNRAEVEIINVSRWISENLIADLLGEDAAKENRRGYRLTYGEPCIRVPFINAQDTNREGGNEMYLAKEYDCASIRLDDIRMYGSYINDSSAMFIANAWLVNIIANVSFDITPASPECINIANSKMNEYLAVAMMLISNLINLAEYYKSMARSIGAY